jgi:hypothetical protein
MARPDQPMQLDRAIRQVDALLPPHAHRGGPRERFWTTRDGQFRVTLHDGESLGMGVVSFGTGLWHVTVPRTGAGLDALTVCMVLAGAIDAPRTGSTTVVERGGAFSFVTVNRDGDLENYPGAEAFALGVQLVEQSGLTGRY